MEMHLTAVSNSQSVCCKSLSFIKCNVNSKACGRLFVSFVFEHGECCCRHAVCPFQVAQFNADIQIYQTLTLVAMVTKTWEFLHKISYNSAHVSAMAKSLAKCQSPFFSVQNLVIS